MYYVMVYYVGRAVSYSNDKIEQLLNIDPII